MDSGTPSGAAPPECTPRPTIGLDELLFEVSRESERLVVECGAIQRSISALLEMVHHPDLAAEIHILQDIDRIQQTLSDVAALLRALDNHAKGPRIATEEIRPVIRLEGLRHRLGLGAAPGDDPPAPGAANVTWF